MKVAKADNRGNGYLCHQYVTTKLRRFYYRQRVGGNSRPGGGDCEARNAQRDVLKWPLTRQYHQAHLW